jgi:DNA-binding FadR family transcriptional regulator
MINESIAAFDHAILGLIASHQAPIGQGALNARLPRLGFRVSTPTVGRRLQELEFSGFLRKVNVSGRVLTEQGVKRLRELEDDAQLRGSGEALLRTLKRDDREHLLDLLSARQVIEGEAAARAAEHASRENLRKMERALERQAASIRAGRLGIEHDVCFHREIARASRSPVLQSLVALLRTNQRYNLVITSMRAVVGHRLVVDHRAILAAIHAHDPAESRKAMERHLRTLAEDLDSYWKSRKGAMLRTRGGEDGNKR